MVRWVTAYFNGKWLSDCWCIVVVLSTRNLIISLLMSIYTFIHRCLSCLPTRSLSCLSPCLSHVFTLCSYIYPQIHSNAPPCTSQSYTHLRAYSQENSYGHFQTLCISIGMSIRCNSCHSYSRRFEPSSDASALIRDTASDAAPAIVCRHVSMCISMFTDTIVQSSVPQCQMHQSCIECIRRCSHCGASLIG